MAENDGVISGNIESLIGGVLEGWAARIGDCQPICLAVVNEKGMLVGKGNANIYREDLFKNKVNEGNHGFKIYVNSELLKNGSTLSLKELSSNKDISVPTFTVLAHEHNVRFLVEGLEGNKLKFNISQTKPRIDYTFCFRIDSEVFAYYKIKDKNQYITDNVELPIKYLQGEQHLVEVYQNQEPLVQFAGIIEGHKNMPTWKSLGKKPNNEITTTLVDETRYESLSLQIQNIDSNPNKMRDIKIAHQLLIERKSDNYPTFALPKYTQICVSIIIYCDKSISSAYRCVASIVLSYNFASYEVILIDNTCSKPHHNIQNTIENLIVITLNNKKSYIEGCNEASRQANGEYLLFLDCNSELCSFAVDELIRPFLDDENVGLTGGKILRDNGRLLSAGGKIFGNGETNFFGDNESAFKPEWNYQRVVDYVSNHAFCVNKKLFLDIGCFDNEFKPSFFAEVDLSMAIQANNKLVIYSPFAKVFITKENNPKPSVSCRREEINASKFRTKWFDCINKYPLPNALNKINDTNNSKRILVIDYAIPNLGVDAGSYAAIQEMKLMQALGFKVTFAAETLASLGDNSLYLQKMGIEVLYFPFYSSVKDVLARRLEEMSAVYITRYTVAKNYIDQIKEAGKVVLFNNADLHFLREIRAAHISKNIKEIKNAWLTREDELTVCNKADAVLTYSTTEQAVIASHTEKTINFHTTPWVLKKKDSGPEFTKRTGIAFLGGYKHKPNIEAVIYLTHHIMPILLKSRPEIVLNIYGSNMPESFNDLDCDNVRLKGFAENLDEVYHSHRIFVAPLQSGAGIKGKVLDALAYQLPCVLSDVAAEGTGMTHGISTFIANTKKEWVEHIIRIYDDETQWTKIRKNEGLLAQENYSFRNGVKRFREIFESHYLL